MLYPNDLRTPFDELQSTDIPVAFCDGDPVATIESIEDELTEMAGHINAINYRFIKLLADFDFMGGWKAPGVKSYAAWLNWKCGIGLMAAREKVRVARALSELPLIDEAFRSGEISYSKVRAMTRVATPENEPLLLQIAQHGTAQHIERTVRKYRRVQKVCDPTENWKRTPDFKQWFDEDGMTHIHLKLNAEDAALVLAAVEQQVKSESEESIAEENVSAETFSDTPMEIDEPVTTWSEDRANAFHKLAEHYLATATDDLQTLDGPGRCELIVHVNANDAHQDHHINDGPCCYLDQNRFISPETARRLACDAIVSTVVEDNEGNVLNIGRRSRTISKAIRTALGIRDNGCRFPGCCQTRWTDAHHIHHWADGGETSLDNLITLCRLHHRLLHKGEFSIVKKGDKITFYNTQREPIPDSFYPQFENSNPEGIVGDVKLQHVDLEIDPSTAVTRWSGEKIDYDMAINGLVVRDGLE